VPFDLETLRRQLSTYTAKRQDPAGPRSDRDRRSALAADPRSAVSAIKDPNPGDPGVQRRAAVAAIVRQAENDTEVLLIRRAERQGDPWSGHMAFPGGHHEPSDVDLRATAIRETLEEIGLDLREHEYLGQLDELAAVARGRLVGMTITPHVFALRADTLPTFRLNYEVAELVWGSLDKMFRGELDGIKELNYDGEPRRLPAFKVRDHLVWGMTHNMLCSLFQLLDEEPRRAV
jgi:8-oxo-dGTP pyrophosphatase MutT (NUDIX family)